MLVLNIQQFKIGILEMNTEKVVFTILLLNGDCAREPSPKFHGPKSKQVRPLHGNIQVVF